MRGIGPRKSLEESRGFSMVPSSQANAPRNRKAISLFGLLLLISNVFTYTLSLSGEQEMLNVASGNNQLYLIDEASQYIPDTYLFEEKIKSVSDELDIPPSWLMSVIYSESRFNPAVSNFKGSGAVGLIQFMVPTVKELNIRMGTRYYMKDIQAMAAHKQLDLVQAYFETMKERYGAYDSLTDLYLAVLYPKARQQDYCYTLYSKPTRAYKMNSGLDENSDGSVTVSDIDSRMKRLFPTAYMASK